MLRLVERRLLLGALSAVAVAGALMSQSCHSDDECPNGEHLCGIQGCSVKGVCPAPITGTAPAPTSSPDASGD